MPPHFGEVTLTPEEQEVMRLKEARKDKLHQDYLRRKAEGKYQAYRDKTKSAIKEQIDAKKAVIRAEDMVYADSLPTRLVDNLIRYGYDSTNSAALFEMAVDKMFVLMGYGMRSRKQSEERKPSLRTASTLPCRTSSPKMRTPLLRGNSYWSSSLAGV